MRSTFYNLFTVRCSFVAAVILFTATVGHAQAPGIQWQKSYGGSGLDGANNVRQTNDGGFIYGAYSNSNDSEVTGNHGDVDCWVVKTDSAGNIQWERSLGGSGYDQVDQIKIDVNGGYIVAAFTTSDDGDVTGNHGGGDGWLIKLDDTGGIVWQKVMGSSGYDFFNTVCNTPDSGYIIVGAAGADGGDISGYLGGGGDVWVIKCTKTGAISWNKVYGGTAYEIGFDVVPTADNGCYGLGVRQGAGSIAGYIGGVEDAWLLRLDDTGGLSWAKTYGGSEDDKADALIETAAGNYIVAGYSNSNDGNVSNNHGGYDFWAVAVDDTGKVLWDNCYGGSGYESAFAAVATFDGGAILGGVSTTTSGEITGTHGEGDFWSVKINDTGGLVWENSFGGSLGDTIYGIIQTADSGYLLTGTTHSKDGDVTTTYGGGDMWSVKLAKDIPTAIIPVNPIADIKVYPTLTRGLVHIDMQQGYEKAVVKLTDILGRSCLDIPMTTGLNRTVSLNGLPAGVFLLQVINNGRVNTYKINYHP